MKNSKKIEKKFIEWLNNLDTKKYWSGFDSYYKEYLLEKDIDKEIKEKKINSEIKLKNYLQNLINFFKIEALWNEVAEAIWVDYQLEVSKVFHEKINKMILNWYEWNDVYEDFLETEKSNNKLN